MATIHQQQIHNGMMTTGNSHTFSTNDAVAGRQSSSNSSTQFEDEAESDFLLDTTPVYAPDSRSNTGGGAHVPNREPENSSPSSSLSYDRISGVTDVIPGAEISQNLDPSEDRRTEPSIATDQLWGTGRADGRGDYHTLHPDRSIRTLVSHSESLDQDISNVPIGPRRPWTPFFLRPNTIVSFIIAYVLLLVALIVLAILDDKNQGLATVDSNIRYVWTYGPTAVLATLAGVWGQVEHRMRQVMPWAILHNGPTSAENTLLLNYIEPAQPISLYRSIKNGHYPVTIAIVGSLLIQLLTIISTGLLILQVERTHRYGVGIQTAEAFGLRQTNVSFGSSPVLSAIALNSGNLSYPLGTSHELAFSTLHVKDINPGSKNISIETTTDVFHADIGCEIVNDFYWDDECFRNRFKYGDCESADAVVTFDTPSCRVHNLTMGGVIGSQTKGVLGGSTSVKCDNSSSSQRFAVVLANYMIGLEYDESGSLRTNQKLTIGNTSLLLCQPSYAIEPYRITVNDTGTLVSKGSISPSGSTASSIMPMPQWDFMEAFLQSISNADSAAAGPASSAGDFAVTDDTQAMLNDFFNALVAFSKPPNITDLLEANILLNETTRFFSMASAQLARNYLMTPSSKVITGTVSADEQRLRIRGLSLYLMMAILGFLIADAALLCFTCPRNTVSRDPGSVGGLAVIMKESPSICDILFNKSLWNTSQLRSCLSKYQGLSVLHSFNNSLEFRVVLTRFGTPSKMEDSEKVDDSTGLHWWQPISMRLWVKGSITVFLLLLIAALESTYQTSKQHDGLADVETESYVRYTWAYVPAVAMLTAQLLVGMIGDSSRILFPYHELRHKPDCATENLFNDPLSKVTVHTVYSAIRLRQYALIATGFSMLLTPFLTIVSSGLFSPELTTRAYDSTFKIENVLNTTIDLGTTAFETSLGSQSSFILNLILTNNLSYPEWTHGELAFHKMTIDEVKGTDKDLGILDPDPTGLTIRATVPAVRPSLNCTYFAAEHVHISYTEDVVYDFDTDKGRPYTDIIIHTSEDIQLPLPEECRNQTVDYQLDGNFTDYQSQPFAWFGTTMHGIRGSQCSNVIAGFGSSLRNGSAQTMMCVPVVEQVQTDTIFSLPSYEIISATPNDTTALPIANFTAAAINVNDFMPVGAYSSDTSATNGGNYDAVFSALLAAPGIAKLVSSDFDVDAAAHPKIADALQHLFRLTYVQVLNLNARNDVPGNASDSIVSGNSSMPRLLDGQIIDAQSRTRLKQSAVSTRILEGLLGAIVVCLLVSFCLLDTRKVMPENACSIAVAASLIAGADMLRDVASGAEWWNDDEAVKKEVFGKDAVFGLAWWGADERDGEMGEHEGNTGAAAERDVSEEVRGVRRRRFGIDRGRASSD